MSEITYIICDECGDRVASYDYDLTNWVESDEDEDWCPSCAKKKQAAVPTREAGSGDGGAG